MKTRIFALVVVTLTSMSLLAQVNIEQQLVIVQNDGNVGGEFRVALRVKGTNLTAANTLGSATIDILYPATRLRFPDGQPAISMASKWNPSLDSSAYTRVTSNPGSGFVRVIVAGGTVNNGGDGTPAGFDLSNAYQTLVTVAFRIVDTTQATSLSIETISNALSLFTTHNNIDLSWNALDVPAASLNRTGIIEQPSSVTFATFSAIPNPSGAGVRVDWTTLSETGNQGFYLQRRADRDSLFVEIPNSFQAGHGTTADSATYSLIDNGPFQTGRYYYRLRHVDIDGTQHFTSGTAVSVDVVATYVAETAPLEFKLYQNYPNPFNPTTEIKFSVEKTGRARVVIYSIIGQEVETLFDAVAEAGRYYTLHLDARHLATGVYLYRLENEKRTDLKKMALIK